MSEYFLVKSISDSDQLKPGMVVARACYSYLSQTEKPQAFFRVLAPVRPGSQRVAVKRLSRACDHDVSCEGCGDCLELVPATEVGLGCSNWTSLSGRQTHQLRCYQAANSAAVVQMDTKNAEQDLPQPAAQTA